MAHATGIVTPEAVRLDFETAGAGSRTAAILLDLLLQGAIALLLLLAVGLLGAQTGAVLPEWVGVTLLLVVVFLLIWGYPVTFETLLRGRTPGKAAMGLRVVTVEGAPVGFRHAAIRAALGLVDFHLSAGGVAIVSTLLTSRSQRLGDLVAGTLVLRERTGVGAPSVARFRVPQGAEAYAATIDAAGMTPGDYATVRSFLLRAGDLAADVRTRLAAQIAQPLAERLAHAPPREVSPELFLVCAAARYQQRAAGETTSAATPAPPAAADDVPRSTSSDGDRDEVAGDGFVPPT